MVHARESSLTNPLRLAAAQAGLDLWRNNNGAFQDATGRWVRYGLCNDSAALSKRIKSSDWVGITPVLITPEMVGQTLGVFTAAEQKHEGWEFSPTDERACAQAAFHAIVRNAGGFAGFVTCVADLFTIIKRPLMQQGRPTGQQA